MRTVLFPGDRQVVVTDTPTPSPAADQVLVEIKAAGLCGSDLHQQYRVPADEREGVVVGHHTSPNTIPGHEPAGVVAEVGANVFNLRPGDRVAVAHVTGCGSCQACRRGRDIDCPQKVFYGLDRDGAFADYMLAEAKDCIRLPETVTFAEGAFWACGAGTGYAALTRGGLLAGETVAVVGLGPVGTAAAYFAGLAGARVIGLDPIPERRDHAAALGAKTVLDPTSADFAAQYDEATGNRGADLVVEASGVPAGRRTTIDIAAVGGRVVFVGLGDRSVDFDIDIMIQKQVTCMGSWVFGTPDLQDMIDKAVDLGISVEPMITFRYRLEDAVKALEAFDAGSLGKTVFVWD
jgi:L-iditol 2-dehydrogenase